MKSTFAVGDHARMFTSGIEQAFGTARGLGHLRDRCGIVVEAVGDTITLDMGDYGLVKCSAKNAYQTMPAGGFEDMPDYLPWEDETTNPPAAAPVGVPTVKEELNRKLGNTLDWAIGKHKQGVISDEALSVAADALFMATSGLANDDLMAVVTAIGSYLPNNKAAVQKRVFTKAGSTIVASWVPGDSGVTCWVDGNSRKVECDSPAAAANVFKAINGRFETRGYAEVK